MDAMLDEDTGDLVFYATWKNGQKTRHDKGVIYVKCPQKVRGALAGYAQTIQGGGLSS